MIYPAESVFVFVFSFVFFSLCFGFIQWKPFFSRQHNNVSYKMLSLQRPQLLHDRDQPKTTAESAINNRNATFAQEAKGCL